MKNFRLFKLGHKNIAAHKFCTSCGVVIIGVVFGIFAATTIHEISKNQKELSDESKATDGKVLMAVKMCDGDYLSGNCETPEEYDAEVLKTAKKYGGETLGAKITYLNQQNEKVYVILERAGKILNHEKTFYISGEKIPVVKKNKAEIDENFYQSYAEYTSDETPFYIMMDNTATVIDFLAQRGFLMQEYEPLVIFGDEDSAYRFYKNENVSASQLFSKTISTKEKLDKIINAAIITFLVILAATIILLGIFGIVLSRIDKKNIRLYRTFGATKKDIFKIYLMFSFEIFTFSLIVSLTVYLITTAIISG